MLLLMHMTAKHVWATGRSCEGRLCTVHLFAHFVCVVSAELSCLWFSSRAAEGHSNVVAHFECPSPCYSVDSEEEAAAFALTSWKWHWLVTWCLLLQSLSRAPPSTCAQGSSPPLTPGSSSAGFRPLKLWPGGTGDPGGHHERRDPASR